MSRLKTLVTLHRKTSPNLLNITTKKVGPCRNPELLRVHRVIGTKPWQEFKIGKIPISILLTVVDCILNTFSPVQDHAFIFQITEQHSLMSIWLLYLCLRDEAWVSILPKAYTLYYGFDFKYVSSNQQSYHLIVLFNHL